MKSRIFKVSSKAAVLLAVVVFAATQSYPSTNFQTVVGSSDAVVGSWMLTISSDTFPSSFRGLVTLSDGGGVVASAQGDVLLSAPPGVPPVATAAHGTWKRLTNRDYLITFKQVFYNSDGSYAGGAKIRNFTKVNDDKSQMAGRLVVEYLDQNDAVIFTGTGTFTGTRIIAESLD